MKVSELSSPELDYWVAKAEGFECSLVPADDNCPAYCEVKDIDGWHEWSPSIDWSIGGPIIERERIDVSYDVLGSTYDGVSWVAEHPENTREYWGNTSLIATMRAYVASKFGEEVNEDNY